MKLRAAIAGVVSLAVVSALDGQQPVATATLEGWAMMPADTFSDGPTSGQFAGAGQFGRRLPLVDRQPVQGFSAVIEGPTADTFYVLQDNGFGSKANSADTLLRVYAVRPEFRSARGGLGTVSPVHFRTGARLAAFANESYITLHDPDRRVSFAITADGATYPGTPAGVAVAPAIRMARLLTGGDFDPESFRVDRAGHFWFGDEFGPFLLQTDRTGRVLRAEVPLAGVITPDSPHREAREPNLGRSRGFEAMARSPAGDRLYPMLEGTVTGDPPGVLRMHEFDVTAARYTGRSFRYRLSEGATSIGDMTAVDATRFLVIERNDASGGSGPQPPFKRIFITDISGVADTGMLSKREVADLMNLADPDDLNQDGSRNFTFPFITIENVLVVARDTILVINDNNYPAGGGRGPTSDHTEFLLIKVPGIGG
jgi:hypothetical protein